MIACSILAWLAARKFSAQVMRPPVPDALQAEPSQNWTQTQKKAWQSIESICRRMEEESPELDDWNAFTSLFRETVETVAVHFHPDQDQAFLEMRVPDFLSIVELLSHDLRDLTTEHIPGSHIVTINDVMKGQKMVRQLKKIYNWYRFASFAVTPVNALVNEIRHRLTGGTVSLVYKEMKLYMTCACIRKVGFYAIKLYSGELDFDAKNMQAYVSALSENDRLQVEKRDQQMAQEPLRIVVVGQTNSGKSSLINRLFGEVRTAVDVVPTTNQVQPFVLEKDGLPEAIILDTGGYEDSTGQGGDIEVVEQALDSADLIIMVCIANHPARDADKKLLQSMRFRFRQENRESPECIVALSHIDLLRPFREWSPPYGLNPAQGKKSEMIVAAMEATADDLELDVEHIVPINLQDGYNVNEALVPTILRYLPEAQRHQYLRCLDSFHEENYWKRIWEQSKGAGVLLVSSGSDWVKKKWERD